MTSFLTVLLYLGLSLNIRIPVLAGPLSKPTLRAVPSNVVATGNQVTFFCEAPMVAKEYRFYKEGSQDYLTPTTILKTENKATFSISSVQWHNAGQYWCGYKSSKETSEHSDTLELVVTGVHPSNPILSAIPSPVVTSGGNVTLQCESQEPNNTFVLMKDGKKLSSQVPSQNMSSRLFGAVFTVGPVTANQRWRFTCYGYYGSTPQLWSVPSNHLELLVSGTIHKPNIWAEPGLVIPSGSPVTIWCEATLGTQIYVIYKEGNRDPWGQQIQMAPNKAKLIIPYLTRLQAGSYHCYSYNSAGWSERSDTLELVMTGVYRKPTLSIQQDPVVNLREPVTLSCSSNMNYDRFILTKDGQKFSSSQSSRDIHTGMFLTVFQVHLVTSRQRWIFRCFGYYTSNPQVWSEASDPLELLVSGNLTKPTLWAEPGSLIALGNAVTVLCEGTKETQIYFLYKEGSPAPFGSQTPKHPGNKALFSIASMQRRHAGKYRCYSYGSAGWSQHSDPLELVVTGVYSGKVTLSTLTSPLVTSGQIVTLQCVSQQAYNGFILLKEDQIFSSAASSPNINHGLSGAHFKVGPVTPDQRWRFTCYGYYLKNLQVWSVSSNDLQLLVSGNLQKPSIWAQPGSVVSSGSSVTIWCAGTLQALTYVIHKEGSPGPSHTETQVDHNNKANFSIPSVSSLNAGRYNCYSYSSTGWTERSDTLELVVTGVHDGKPTLSALPRPVVTSGGNVSLQCNSSKGYDGFTLTGADLKFPRSQKAQFTNNGQFQALFPMISLTYSMNGPFRCYGYYTNTSYVWSEASNPLEIHVSGLSRKPDLVTQQGTVLAPGENLTLKCFSETNYDRFALYKEGEHDLTQVSACQSQDQHFHANFTVGSGNYFIGGRYRCLGAHSNSSEWSAPSDPLDILITGHPLVALNLSVHPGPTVSSGENVTLLCWSSGPVDTFFLFKEGEAHPYMQQSSQSQDPQHEAKFSMSAVTSALGGSYICFGSKRESPFLLSHSSVPVDIIVSGPASHQKAVVGVSVVLFLLLFLLILFLLLRCRHQTKDRKGAQTKTDKQPLADSVTRDKSLQNSSNPAPAIQEEVLYAAVKIKQPADRVELDVLSPCEEDPSKDLYAQVKPSRRRRAEMTSSPLQPKKSQASHERKTKGVKAVDEQAARSDGLDDVTYAQLCIMTPKQGQVDLPSSRKKRPT